MPLPHSTLAVEDIDASSLSESASMLVDPGNGSLGSGSVPKMPRDRIGLIGGSWEVTPVDIRSNYVRYLAGCTR